MGSEIRLDEELPKHKGKTVLLGVRSSFFFIGPCEEAMKDMALLGVMIRACVAISTNKRISVSDSDDIGKRKVIKTYIRNPEYGNNEIVIIVEGRELGSFWTREEYLDGKRVLLAAMDAARNAKQTASRKTASA